VVIVVVIVAVAVAVIRVVITTVTVEVCVVSLIMSACKLQLAEAVVNVFDFIDQLNYSETTDGQQFLNSNCQRNCVDNLQFRLIQLINTKLNLGECFVLHE
jgi:hypothetical protein